MTDSQLASAALGCLNVAVTSAAAEGFDQSSREYDIQVAVQGALADCATVIQ